MRKELFTRWLTLLLVILLCTNWSTISQAKISDQSYQSGAYTGVGKGNNGIIIVEVVFDEQKITSIEVKDHSETPGISDVPIERIPRQVVEYQSLKIDAISGATNTSIAILEGIEDCVKQANGNVEALLIAPVPIKKAGSLIEKSADVIILGGGGSGITAAVAAAQEGASVIVVEKTAALGGNTILAGGKMNAVVPETQEGHVMTESQKAEVRRLSELPPKGPEMATWQDALRKQFDDYEKSGKTHLFDSIELHMIQTYVDGDYFGDPVLIESMCKHAPETYKWMEELGYEWNPESEIVIGALWPRSQHGLNYKSGIGFIDIYTR